MRTILYPIVAVVMLAVIAADHYTVNSYLSEFEEARNYNNAEMVQAFQMQDTVLFAQGLQEALLITSRRMEKVEAKIIQYVEYIKQLQIDLKNRDSAIEHSVGTIKNLTDDNAQLQTTLDTMTFSLFFEKLKVAGLTIKVKELEILNESMKKELATLKKSAEIEVPTPAPAR